MLQAFFLRISAHHADGGIVCPLSRSLPAGVPYDVELARQEHEAHAAHAPAPAPADDSQLAWAQEPPHGSCQWLTECRRVQDTAHCFRPGPTVSLAGTFAAVSRM